MLNLNGYINSEYLVWHLFSVQLQSVTESVFSLVCVSEMYKWHKMGDYWWTVLHIYTVSYLHCHIQIARFGNCYIASLRLVNKMTWFKHYDKRHIRYKLQTYQ